MKRISENILSRGVFIRKIIWTILIGSILIFIFNTTSNSESFDEYYENWKEKKGITQENPYKAATEKEAKDFAQENIDNTFKDYKIQHLEEMFKLNSSKIEELRNDIDSKEKHIVYLWLSFSVLTLILTIYSISITIKYKKIKKGML